MTRRLLLLRSGRPELPEEGGSSGDVDLLVTHEALPLPAGIAEARAFDATGATLAVTSRITVDMLLEGGGASVLSAPWNEVLSAGEETARALREAGAPAVRVPAVPGARGILSALPEDIAALRLLWPHGSDADTAPFDRLRERGARVTAPFVYEKRPVAALDAAVLSRFLAGGYAAVAVGSLAALDVLLAALALRAAGKPLPPVRWGVLGPETARAFESRGLPRPVIPPRPRILDLLELLRTGEEG